MKVGGVEGSAKEIRDFFQDNGLNVEDYLERPRHPPGTGLFVLPSIITGATVVVSALVPPSNSIVRLLLFLVGLMASIWLSVNIHVKYKSAWSAFWIIVGTVALLLIADGVIAPLDLFNKLMNMK